MNVVDVKHLFGREHSRVFNTCLLVIGLGQTHREDRTYGVQFVRSERINGRCDALKRKICSWSSAGKFLRTVKPANGDGSDDFYSGHPRPLP